MRSFVFAIGFLTILTPAIGAKPPQADDAANRLEDAKKAGWQVVEIVLPKLNSDHNPGAEPGLHAIVEDIRKARAAGESKVAKGQAASIDIEALVTHNPNFWQAQYEVAPGDPAWLLLHGGLFLAAGEATRAQAVLILARQREDLPAPIRVAVNHLLGHSARILKDGNRAVELGIAPFDRGELDSALKIYRQAVTAWPANGWGHFEIGLTLMTKQAKSLNVDISKEVRTRKPGEPELQTDEVLASFAASRLHDPFQWKAYQGKFDEAKPRLIGLTKKVLPTWAILLQGKSPGDAEILAFSEGLQEAGVDDLALVARQIVVSRRGRFAPGDHPFAAKSLRQLAPGPKTEDVLRKLSGDRLEVRQIVKPEPPKR